MADHRGRLLELLAHHHQLAVDQPEGVDDHLALHALNGVHHHRDVPRVQLLEGLRLDSYPVGVHVDRGQPAAEARVRVVPAHHVLRPVRLLQHFEHLRLEDRVYRLDRHARPALGHRENVDHLRRVLVFYLLLYLWEGRRSFTRLVGTKPSPQEKGLPMKLPSMSPMTSIGIPARPCFSILRSASEEMMIVSEESGMACDWPPPGLPPICPSMFCKPPKFILLLRPEFNINH